MSRVDSGAAVAGMGVIIGSETGFIADGIGYMAGFCC
jgi:hypothetical protein